ncbi:MAG: hypothetical protein LBP76_04120, partial [Treponema sp.]|nr:hypothetical protein [Treponema sp.]
MAEFHLKNVTISYEGGDAAVEAFEKALKEKQSGAVLKALKYVDEYSLAIDYNARSITDPDGTILSNGDGELPLAFADMVHCFKDITFIFDITYEGTAAYCWGDGRYYCVYERGKKVYDANTWLEQLGFLNIWLEDHGVKANCYSSDIEEDK